MKEMNKNQELLSNYANLDLLKLPEKIKKREFEYILVERTNDVLMYSQHKGGIVLGYEVFKNKIRKYREDAIRRWGINSHSKSLPEYKEVFPHDEEFGKRAWTYPDLQTAKESYNNLVKQNVPYETLETA